MTKRMIPALPNHYPYNELLLSKRLSAKTRDWRWKHTGLTLLYTSTRTAQDVVSAHKLFAEAKTAPRMVLVGVGELLPVRENTSEEIEQIEREFENNGWFVNARAGKYRFEFKNLRRFRKPVPFRPPTGAVRVFGVPVRVVARALKEVGINPSKLSFGA